MLRLSMKKVTMTQIGGSQMETLIKIVKIIAPVEGYENHYKVEGSNVIKIDFIARPLAKGGK